MADDSKGASRSMEDEMLEALSDSIVTPAETFFFALFVLGILSLAATTLVGTCGNVDDLKKRYLNGLLTYELAEQPYSHNRSLLRTP